MIWTKASNSPDQSNVRGSFNDRLSSEGARRSHGLTRRGGRADKAQVHANTFIYRSLADHQKSEPWFGRSMIETLQVWGRRFNVQFKLEIPEVSLAIERLRCTTYGRFRGGHNGFGLKGEIALNRRYLFGQRQAWEVLGTLLHELLHAWQQAHGKPGKSPYHNRAFRDKAGSLGLLIDKRGMTGYATESRFKDLLRRFKIEVPVSEIPLPEERVKGDSKLKKWSCGCINVWCAKADLDARCTKCGQQFRRVLLEQGEATREAKERMASGGGSSARRGRAGRTRREQERFEA